MRRIFLFLLAVPAALAAQQRPLTQADWDLWKSIQGVAVSPDGQWVAYSIVPQVGDGELVIRSTTGATEYRVPRGYVGRPQLVPNADSNWTAPAPVWTPDSRHLLALRYAPRDSFERARREKRKAADQPKATLVIVRVADGAIDSVREVKSFRVPKDAGRHAAWLLEGGTSDSAAKGDSTKPATVGATPGGRPRPVAGDSAAKKKEYGTTLVVRDFSGGRDATIADVTAYVFADSGGVLGYTVSSRAAANDGAYARDLASGRTLTLLSGVGNYKQLVLDRGGRQAAFVSDREEYGTPQPRYALYYARVGSAARPVATTGALGGLQVAERGRTFFTRNGTAVVFGVIPAPLDSIPADSLADKAIFDLWHWKDARLQPQQRIEVTRDRDRSFTTVYQIASGKVVRLGTDSIPQVTVSDDGRVGLAVAQLPYAVESMWGEGGADVIVFDATTGKRTLVKQRARFGASLSPGARYVTWFEDGHWTSYDTRSGARANLTGSIPVRFDQETWDAPSEPAPWGIAGWTDGDASVLIYDRYDVWQVDPAGKRGAVNVTDGAGRRDSTVLRIVTLDPDARTMAPSAPVLLSAFNINTKRSGFWRDRLGAASAPATVVMADAAFGTPQKARRADRYVVTRGTFVDFPDLYAGESLDRVAKISNANPQQKDYLWGSVELVQWRSDDGVPLKGLLYKPANFDASKQYPMVVYYYEQLSDNLHQYVAPFGRNVINPTHYASNGYLVFEPDIAYTTGYPGPDALKSIVPGVQKLIDRGFVRQDGIGLQGQSWGGYQTAWLITRTNLFRAAMAGAPVANMTSAYGGIRWESGLARAFQYEKGQSRIGGSLWEAPMRYLENSPLFAADRIDTPLLIMSNDADGAVPWYQGIELFVALRRLGKEVYLVNYNGDGHNPRKRANQKDIAMRMEQFFDHHLKGAPAPEWMKSGIPFLQKGRDQLAPVTAGSPSGAPTAGPATQQTGSRTP
ncbi:MAG TPA: prolyl oligopeptidase family serine peptidase [Gemmatimonadaceae bacterium]|nr:prolyl oligopeptidase family serine peptidase [Gemmatimonadaceae bacterium]